MSIISTIKNFLIEDEQKYDDSKEEHGIFQAGLQGNNDSYRMVFSGDDEKEQVLVLAIMKHNIPENKRKEVAEFLTRCNYAFAIGNLEMDFSDGEVRYRSSIDVEGGTLTSKMVHTLTYLSASCIDKVQPYIMKIVYADKTAAEAYDLYREAQ